LIILIGWERLDQHTKSKSVYSPMKGTTVVLKAPEPTARRMDALTTPPKAAPSCIATGNEVANRMVAPTDSILKIVSLQNGTDSREIKIDRFHST
jgi:hypothetical protein